MFSVSRTAISLVALGAALAAAPLLVPAQQVDVCGATRRLPSGGGPFSVGCVGPGVPGFSPVVSVATFTPTGNDGTTHLRWNITNHGECPFSGPEELKCQINANGGIPVGPVPQGDFDLLLDFTVGQATMVCSCFRF